LFKQLPASALDPCSGSDGLLSWAKGSNRSGSSSGTSITNNNCRRLSCRMGNRLKASEPSAPTVADSVCIRWYVAFQAQICCGDRGGKGKGAPAAAASQGKNEMFTAAEPPDENRRIVEEIEMLAKRLQGPCKKYPKSGASFMSSAKDRFVAVIAADVRAGDMSDGGSSWSAWRHRWRRGKLAYWADEASFRRREEPKGHVDLLSVTRVSCGDCSPQEVTVSHAVGEERYKLIISFADGKRAENWRHALRRLRSLLENGHG